MNMKPALSKMRELIDHEQTLVDLRQQMLRAMTITTLWPTVFDNGPVTSSWRDTRTPEQRSHYKKLGVPFYEGHTFVLTDGAGEVREFSFEQVPEILGGGCIDEG